MHTGDTSSESAGRTVNWFAGRRGSNLRAPRQTAWVGVLEAIAELQPATLLSMNREAIHHEDMEITKGNHRPFLRALRGKKIGSCSLRTSTRSRWLPMNRTPSPRPSPVGRERVPAGRVRGHPVGSSPLGSAELNRLLPSNASVRRAWHIHPLHPRRCPLFTFFHFPCRTAGQIT